MWPDDTASGDGWGGIGPQNDGTYNAPIVTAQPADAGGGAPANYAQQVLDVFKYGVGVVQSQKAADQMLDYRRFEATQGALTQQGTASATAAVAAAQSRVLPLLLLAGGVALVLVLGK